MTGANLLDNLQIPVEDTPDVDVTKAPASPMSPVTPAAVSENDKKMNFLKKHAEAALKDVPEGKSPKFNFDFTRIKAVLLNFIAPLISFGVSLLLIIFIIVPAIRSRPSIDSELSQKTELKNLLNTKKNKLENLRDLKSVFDDNLTTVNTVLVSEQKVPELLTEVDHIARLAGLSVERLSYSISQSDIGPLGYPVIDVSLGVKGSLDQFIEFLKLTENASRLVLVSDYRYSINDDTLSLTLVLQSPYLAVNSSAVTDEPLKLDINSTTFSKFITKIKGLTYYDPDTLEPVVAVETVVEPVVEEVVEEVAQEPIE